MNRTKIGIPGVDDLLNGGIVEGSTVLLSGCSGSGKTIFGLQYIYMGAKEYGEPGIYITLESRPNDLRAEAQQFNWDLEELEGQGSVIIIDAASNKAGLPTSEKYTLRRGFDTSTLAEEIYRVVKSINAKRLVIDSLSGLGVRFSEPSEVRDAVFRISALLRELEVTSLLISEINETGLFSRAGIEHYLTHGLILLDLKEIKGELERSMVIWKMRQTGHSLKRHPFEIGSKGIEIR